MLILRRQPTRLGAVAGPRVRAQAQTTAAAGARIAAVDAARGCAMLLVCVSHITPYIEATTPTLYWFLVMVSRVATPTFLLLSGFVIAHLLDASQRRDAGLTLVDRGLFLLLVGHSLLGLSELAEVGVYQWLFARAGITDAIGIALFAAVLLRRTRAGTLALTGAMLCLGSWVLAATMTMPTETTRLVGAVLFSMRDPLLPAIDLPLVPYLGLFLIGMALSTRFGSLLAGREAQLAARLLVIGLSAMALVSLCILSWRMAGGWLPEDAQMPALERFLHQTIDPRFKRPPSPAYFLFYGGAGLVMLGLLFRSGEGFLAPLVRHASVIGRASLACYVLQDWIFLLLPRVLGYDDVRIAAFWLAYLVAGVAAVYAFAVAWGRVRGNRLLTIGLKGAVRAWRTRRPSAAGWTGSSANAHAAAHPTTSRRASP